MPEINKEYEEYQKKIRDFLNQECCGKPMVIRENAQSLMNDEENSYSFCEECGHVIRVTDYQVDEEEISAL
jgi:RNase P subunit RPR2